MDENRSRPVYIKRNNYLFVERHDGAKYRAMMNSCKESLNYMAMA
jgi:hypothetical protein